MIIKTYLNDKRLNNPNCFNFNWIKINILLCLLIIFPVDFVWLYCNQLSYCCVLWGERQQYYYSADIQRLENEALFIVVWEKAALSYCKRSRKCFYFFKNWRAARICFFCLCSCFYYPTKLNSASKLLFNYDVCLVLQRFQEMLILNYDAV